ncbi:hypothetical protein OU415_19870 [Saccharopolyspora sp. WRP15-2]|uniref:Uncharacterized protein n=1 Tax=Saccharopolyspora oryzae TaxID=2997343 RepID=A0ABT4V2Q6_9PSEU|nr:hypothetical protein [Saccharopolyspora oryzae]MDA3627706.1 hypothetical protein [Saccharopolyspora oryzae]
MCKEEAATAPVCAESGWQVRYFQYRDGMVPEWSRFAHIRRDETGSQVRSWCWRTFRLEEVEDCSAPRVMAMGLPYAATECTDCFVRFAFWESPDSAFDVGQGLIPARIDTPDQMASAMRVLQRELVDEAGRIPGGVVDPDRLGRLAGEVERFGRALRRFGWLAACRS